MRTPRLIVLTIIAAALPSLAGAAEVQATSSTQYLWYTDPLSDHKDQGDVAEYLRVNVSLDQGGQYRAVGYGRVIRQTTTTAESSPDWFGRLYYLFLDGRDVIKDHLDLRVGRTYVNQAAIPGVVDGGFVDFRNLGIAGLGVTAFGGHRATFDDKEDVSKSGDALAGGSVYWNTALQTHLELSYARKYTDKDLAQEFVALQLSTAPLDMLSLLGRASYDVSQSRYSELLLQANVSPWKQVILRGEYYANNPTFDKYSFYSFFGVTQYQQVSATLELQLDSRYRLHGSYAYEKFDSTTDANVFDVGLYLRPLEALVLDIAYENRSGYAGGLNGIRFHGSYRFGKAAILAGTDYADFRRDEARDGTAKRYWVGASYDFARFLGVILRAEENYSFYFSHAYQGFVALNVHI